MAGQRVVLMASCGALWAVVTCFFQVIAFTIYFCLPRKCIIEVGVLILVNFNMMREDCE